MGCWSRRPGHFVWEQRSGGGVGGIRAPAFAYREVLYGSALAFGMSGDSSHAEALADEMEKGFPEDSSVRFSYVPTIRAVLALNRAETRRAAELLQAAAPHELGIPLSAVSGLFGALYPVYVRGQAYLAANKATEAAAEFRKILDHRGIIVSDPIAALSHLQLGKAYALAGDKAKARSAYQDFFTLWRDADRDIPVLNEAEGEYAKLVPPPGPGPNSLLR